MLRLWSALDQARSEYHDLGVRESEADEENAKLRAALETIAQDRCRQPGGDICKQEAARAKERGEEPWPMCNPCRARKVLGVTGA